MMSNGDFSHYFDGHKLIGDDYSPDELKAWFNDEIDAYRGLGYTDSTSTTYYYHALNSRHGFRHVPILEQGRVLGLGSNYGAELYPIASQVSSLTIVEPGSYPRIEHPSFEVKHLVAHWSGALSLPDDSFDLAVSFGTLHHIANVSYVISEVGRVLKPGAFFLIREPMVSMGDWRKPRVGLTKRERGIPPQLLEDAVHYAGLEVISSTPCMFPGMSSLNLLGRPAFNNPLVCALDYVVSALTRWNHSYHRRHWLRKIAPTSLFVVAKKPNHRR